MTTEERIRVLDVWGVQDKALKNIEFWKRSRKVFAESTNRYATVK